MPSLPRPLPPCPARSFPFFSVGVLLPCALLAALGVKVLLTASVLVGWEVIDSLNLIWAQASKHGWKLLLPSAVSDLQALCRWLGAAAASCRALCLPCLHCFHLRTTLSLPCPAPLPPACPLQLSLLVLQGMAPNELVVKRLAMMGCTGVHAICPAVLPCRAALPCCPAALLCLLCSGGLPQQPCPHYLAFAGPRCSCCTDLRLVLSPPLPPPCKFAALVLVHSMKEQRVAISSYAGLLLSGPGGSGGGEWRQLSTRKSLVLLGGRLLMALLFVFVGATQASGGGPGLVGWLARQQGHEWKHVQPSWLPGAQPRMLAAYRWQLASFLTSPLCLRPLPPLACLPARPLCLPAAAPRHCPRLHPRGAPAALAAVGEGWPRQQLAGEGRAAGEAP